MIHFLRLAKRRFCTSSPLDIYGSNKTIGGKSTDNLYSLYAGKYPNQALNKIKYSIKGATIITEVEECRKCLKVLLSTNSIVAWDTETIDLDIKNQSPVGNGKIICASFFAGPQYNFGNGPKVFIDNFGLNAGLIGQFKEYLQNPSFKKVWHNYGFDRHLFYNHGIDVKGFGGDTMHMARLYDSAKLPGEYSLSSLTKSFRKDITKKVIEYGRTRQAQYNRQLNEGSTSQKIYYQDLIKNLLSYQSLSSDSLVKSKLENLFYRKRILKSGKEGKTYEFPSLLTLHTNQEFVEDWVRYSLLDSESTFFLREVLQQKLIGQKSKEFPGFENMWKLYEKYWIPFGELLTDLERQGFKIDLNHIKKIEEQAKNQIEAKKQQFIKYLCSIQPDPNIQYFNPSSTQQMQHLLHAPYKIQMRAPVIDEEMDFQASELLESSPNHQIDHSAPRKNTRTQVVELLQQEDFIVPIGTNTKKTNMRIKGLGIPPLKLTPTGLPSVDADTLKILAGVPEDEKYGKAYDHFAKLNEHEFGKNLCKALHNLVEYRSFQTLLKTFIVPLQEYVDQTGRIHTSLNINTETGRLSARKPNLQNQPALEKDIYKIRKAFVAEKGKKLIVADYGQLELRVLAHLSNCQEMIKAFIEGGDFHSRTAIGMYDYIKKEIEEGSLLLQWDKSKGKAPAPILKQKYASQRRKAKTVNFSIAYGKTAKGFAEDWKCSEQEAKKVIKAWFNDRKQVERWQEMIKNKAKSKMFTQTLLGRYRMLDKFFKLSVGMAMRRAINTPIQGGAADIVIAAMVKIHQNQQLINLGWKLQLQIHDQLILEGPQQSCLRALQLVKYDMSHPFDHNLLVQLEVDAKIGDNWYQCK